MLNEKDKKQLVQSEDVVEDNNSKETNTNTEDENRVKLNEDDKERLSYLAGTIEENNDDELVEKVCSNIKKYESIEEFDDDVRKAISDADRCHMCTDEEYCKKYYGEPDVILKNVDIEKFNPYHDKLGRFTSKNGNASPSAFSAGAKWGVKNTFGTKKGRINSALGILGGAAYGAGMGALSAGVPGAIAGGIGGAVGSTLGTVAGSALGGGIGNSIYARTHGGEMSPVVTGSKK